MVPPYSDKISRVPSYLFVRLLPRVTFRVQGYHPLWPDFPDRSTKLLAKPYQAASRSLATTKEISVDFFSSRY